LVARRPTQNKSLSREKKKGEEKIIILSITISTRQPTNQ
jgi:hypothetical protein